MSALLVACMAAYAFSPEDLLAKVAAIEPLRTHSLGHHDPAIPDDAYTALAKGEMATGLTSVPGIKARIAWGVAVLDVPIGDLFSAVNDGRNKVDYSKLSTVQLLEGEYCGTRRLAFQYLPVPIISDRWWVVEQRINTALHEASQGAVRELVWVKLKDGTKHLDASAKAKVQRAVQAESNDGAWWLVALDDTHTLIEFWALSDPGGSVPAGLAGQFASGSIRDTFQNMERLAQKGPSCSL